MVAADQVYSVRVPQLEANEQRDSLYTEKATVDIVTY
jgi:hypothetical protein